MIQFCDHVFVSVVGSHVCSIPQTFYLQTASMRVTNQVFKTQSVKSAIACANLCSQETDCWAFNVFEGNETKLCELNGNSQIPGIVADPQASFYGM